MTWKIRSLLLIALLSIGGAIMVKADENSTTRQYQESVKAKLETGVPSDLDIREAQQIIDSLKGNSLYSSQISVGNEWVETRELEARLILKMMRAIRRQIDQDFDPADVPQGSIIPPVETGFSSAVDPQLIEDQELREAYERAIIENNKKAEAYAKQHRLHTRGGRFFSKSEEYLAIAYSQPPPHRDELTQLLQEEQVDEETSARVLSKIQEPTGNEGQKSK
jgi:uncharacterized membrane protein YdfJ with MMPL/SSD domain